MKSIYSSPLRVYICLGLLALFGIFAGLSLPISMFPNSSKPTVGVWVPYASLTPDEFAKVYGSAIESRLHSISDKDTKIESIETDYRSDEAFFKIIFDWGVEQKRVLKEVQTTIFGISAQFPKEMRDHLQVDTWSENSGFLAISFYSQKRSLDQLYKLLDPSLTPRLAQVPDTEEAGLFNPSQKQVDVELIPNAMAALQVLPKDVDSAILQVTSAAGGGSMLVDTDQLKIQLPRQAISLDDLRRIPVISRTGRPIHLQDIAHIELKVPAQTSQSFKTSGAPSLILFATPAPGGNIKEMAETILKIVKQLKPTWPSDVQYKILVDPSEFIRNSIHNVFREVVLAAGLAVFILFLFVGSIRNVATAAIEIPLSIILAFILMKLAHININLISLGGLALSAGMNVDASVVVMENIFRHFDAHPGLLTYKQRLEIVTDAVKEVRLPVIASTIASIVVFLPLAFTSNLSYAILGDLAKTVVFSHAFSAVVALILVPTIRMQLMSSENNKPPHSPIEPAFRWLEKTYIRTLDWFLHSKWLQLSCYGGLLATLALLVVFVIPRLPKEIIGMPDSDWMVIVLNTQGNSLIHQMEEQSAQVEAGLLAKFGGEIRYTFTQIHSANRAEILARLKSKSQMQTAWKQFQKYFQNTPYMKYFVVPWNPSSLPIPNPPHFQLSVLGSDPMQRLDVAHQLVEMLEGKNLFSRVWQQPDYQKPQELAIEPHLDQWSALLASRASIEPSDLADISRIATQGREVGQWVLGNHVYDIMLSYPEGTIKTPEDLAAFPIGVNGKVIPLKALADVKMRPGHPPRFRKDQQDVVLVNAKEDKSNEGRVDAAVAAATKAVLSWQKANKNKIGNVSIQIDDAQHELNDALHQLAIAIGLSILLIFVTMIIQLGDLISSLLVMISIPLGLIGVVGALFVFHSTLSLNSALGIILLNGIAVANSIILVDFFNKLRASGRTVTDAALEAAQARLRPILMTSLTTTIGMLPIALGLGDGGRVLQPLGIAVSGGLWISMLFTLYIVPALQVAYWRWRTSRHQMAPFAQRERLPEVSL